METDSISSLILFTNIEVNPVTAPTAIVLATMAVLLLFSAFISGSEVAFFSLSPTTLNNLKTKKDKTAKLITQLTNNPQQLLATILVGNNFVNVGIVILSTFAVDSLFDFSKSPVAGLIFQIVIVSFLLLLFGEILPKVYASKYSLRFAYIMAYPIYVFGIIASPLSNILVKSTSIVNKRFSRRKNISIDDLSYALNLSKKGLEDEKEILEGIIKLKNIPAKEIMKSRLDVVAVDIKLPFTEIKDIAIKTSYSRIPVYANTLDTIKGILYVKDLLPHLEKHSTFRWQSLIRPPYYVPETKKINDLLEEFQKRKIHFAIVIDEYGGVSGIVTLEDILEEIVGEIIDESDIEEKEYVKLSNDTYVFEGKFLINDFYKFDNINEGCFDDIKGDADTLAGVILEIKGEFPKINEQIVYKNLTFTILEEDNRRIKKLKVRINN